MEHLVSLVVLVCIGLFLIKGYSDDSFSFLCDSWRTVATVCSAVTFGLLPELDEALVQNSVRVHSSGGRYNGVKGTVRLSFVPIFSVGMTWTVLVEPLTVLKKRTFLSMVWLGDCPWDCSSLSDMYSVWSRYCFSSFDSRAELVNCGYTTASRAMDSQKKYVPWLKSGQVDEPMTGNEVSHCLIKQREGGYVVRAP